MYTAVRVCLLGVFFLVVGMGFLFWNPMDAVENDVNAGKKSLAELFFCFWIAVAIGATLCLCPWNGLEPFTDSSVFLYIGQQMKAGAIPYKELFDHKGPILYFIQHLGLSVIPCRYIGVWILEIIHLFLTAWTMLKIAKLSTENQMLQFFSVAGVLVACGAMYFEGGNLTEEYALPWIALAVYIFLKFFKTGIYRFLEIILLGVGFAVVFLLRVNMIAVWAAFMPVVGIRLLTERRWRDMGVCAAGFIMGVCLVGIPCLCYLLHTDCLKDMVFCYFGFNMQYSDTDWREWLIAMKSLIWRGLIVIPAVVISAIGNIKNRLWILNMWGIAVSLVMATMSGRSYGHYGIVLVPCLVFPFCGMLRMIYTLLAKVVKGPRWRLSERFVVAFSVMAGISAIVITMVMPHYFHTNQTEYTIDMYLTEHTEESDDVLILGNSVYPYLKNNRRTENRFFYQSPPLEISDTILDLFLEEMDRVKSDTIVVPGNKQNRLSQSGNFGVVCRLLEEQFRLGVFECEEFDDFYVYTRK